MAQSKRFKLPPASQLKISRGLPLATSLRQQYVCNNCAMRQIWLWRRAISSVTTMSAAQRMARRCIPKTVSPKSGLRALPSFLAHPASSRKGTAAQRAAIERSDAKSALGSRSISSLSVHRRRSPSHSSHSSFPPLRKNSSYIPNWSLSRAVQSRQASTDSSTTTPTPTAPPTAADTVDTDSISTSSTPTAALSTSALHNLYDALKQLRDSGAASVYVDLKRLELVIRGVEDSLERASANSTAAGAGPVIRLAALGLDNQRLTRRLVKLLLADPLGKEEEWEKQLDSAENDDGRAILVRYGERADLSLHNRLLYSFTVPSPFLQKNNVEILITTIDYASSNHELTGEEAAKAMLNPMLLAPSSATERQTAITFPVHTALVVGEGLESCITFGRLSAGQAQRSPLVRRIKFIMLGTNNAVAETVSAASRSSTVTDNIASPIRQEVDVEKSMDSEFTQIDAERANEALSLFRKSAVNAAAYEQGWHQAHMPQLLDWICSQSADNIDASKESLKPAVRTLVSSVLADTHVSIGKAQARLRESEDAMLISSATKNSLSVALDTWSKAAYKELRNKLDVAFAKHAWRSLSWYKLFWRADDVGPVAVDILTRDWLVDAEHEIVYLCGRMEEAGYYFPEPDENSEEGVSSSDGRNLGAGVRRQREYSSIPRPHYQAPGSGYGDSKVGSLPPSQTMSDVVRMRKDTVRARADTADAQLSDAVGPMSSSLSGGRPPAPLGEGPWPAPIPEARLTLYYKTVPPLHRRAQTLLVSFICTSSASFMLGGLLSGASSVGMYEAGAVALVGIAWAFWRFQMKWDAERLGWEGKVRELGRGAVRDTEAMVREILGEQKMKRIGGIEGKGEGNGGMYNEYHRGEAKLLTEAAGPAERALKALEKMH